MQIGNAGVRYNDPQENVVPGQVPNSNFPGSGVSILSMCSLTPRASVPFRLQLPCRCRAHTKDASDPGCWTCRRSLAHRALLAAGYLFCRGHPVDRVLLPAGDGGAECATEWGRHRTRAQSGFNFQPLPDTHDRHPRSGLTFCRGLVADGLLLPGRRKWCRTRR